LEDDVSAEPSIENLRAQIDELVELCKSTFHEIDAAIESGEKELQLAAGRAVDALAARYRALRDGQIDKARRDVEMALDRRITDLRRSAASLVQRVGGSSIARASDAGFVPFIEQRSPTSGPAPAEWPTLAPKRVGVGTEIESWCGKCKDMRTHSIVAMVGDQPKQVICQTCGSKHNHRSERPQSAQAKVDTSAGSPSAGPAMTPRERSRREELRRDLQRELNASIEVRPFDPKGEFKRGEIISHPQFGRGKVENVLKGSILVRFLEGLRPLDLR
jgi:hypothetical protein